MARRPSRPQVEPAATLGPLRLIWRAAARYPGYIAAALLALAVTAAATLAISGCSAGASDETLENGDKQAVTIAVFSGDFPHRLDAQRDVRQLVPAQNQRRERLRHGKTPRPGPWPRAAGWG